MTGEPKLRLSRLRDIGWSIWDPIGILAKGEVWDGKPFADEYDTYLLYVAGELRRGRSASDMIEYLYGISSNHMGLGGSPELRVAAASAVRAILDDDQLWNYD